MDIYRQELEENGITITNLVNSKKQPLIKRGNEELGFMSIMTAHKYYVLKKSPDNVKTGDIIVTLEYGEGVVKNVLDNCIVSVFFLKQHGMKHIESTDIIEAYQGRLDLI